MPLFGNEDGRRTMSLVRWGLVPFWANDASIGSKMINARSDTVLTKSAFQRCFVERRVISLENRAQCSSVNRLAFLRLLEGVLPQGSSTCKWSRSKGQGHGHGEPWPVYSYQ
ncbi:MAG: SOS response-associated peptidase family protein [Terriglobia bacterium]